tara:strand:+ start:39 stop:161 length:123 start_codon:yes stop_codon:yes gene_type:complete
MKNFGIVTRSNVTTSEGSHTLFDELFAAFGGEAYVQFLKA